ncbi:MAG: hypothetical protein R3D84_05975 [Paracoccaceae bacterium]
MVGASKILTVSYGTFSCTLEGFDDPFSTMKAIAEYFRDLAADDRYFGAEPPTPDAAMLHQIAEREIKRKVEARVQDNGVLLRADDADAYAAPAPTAHPADPTEAARPAAAAPLDAPVADPVYDDETPSAPVAAEDDSVAAKLLRIRAAVANARESESRPAAAAHTAANLDQIVSAPPPPVVEQTLAGLDDDYVEDAETVDEGIDLARLTRDLAAPEAEAAEEAPEDIDAAEDELAEIARVADAEDMAASDGDADATDEAIDSILSALGEPAEELAEAAPEEEPELAEMADAELAGDIDAASDSADADVYADTEAAEVLETGDDAIVAETEAFAEHGDDDALEPAEVADDAADEDQSYGEAQDAADIAADEVAEDEPAPAPAMSAETAEKLARARARVIHVRRSDDGKTEASVSYSDDDHDGGDDDTDRLTQEIARAGGEVSDSPARPRDTARGEARVRDAGDPDVSRILKLTNSAIGSSENQRRHSTISHLKAAVVATEAERDHKGQGRDEATKTTEMDSYRSDLAAVVRPRRPVATGAGRRDSDAKPGRLAPLVLISEQRIDLPSGGSAPVAPAMPAQPRRVSAGNLALHTEHADELDDEPVTVTLSDEVTDDEIDDRAAEENLFEAGQNFADFAEKVGAQGLTDLLEAAAAYLTGVEGREFFSRPQLIRRVQELPENADMTREDSLRSFGMLLRQGRIAKVKRGQFAVSEQSRFLAEAEKLASNG